MAKVMQATDFRDQTSSPVTQTAFPQVRRHPEELSLPQRGLAQHHGGNSCDGLPGVDGLGAVVRLPSSRDPFVSKALKQQLHRQDETC